jgi:predicted lipoprotein with Yx(FWY)xxD motif
MRKRVMLLGAWGLFALAACGSGSGSTGVPGTGSQPTPTSTTASPVVATATAMVAGKSSTILTDSAGMTLYYFTADTPSAPACTGACASTWPPLVITSGDATSATALPGTLSILNDANGTQVTYNSHPLYHYSGDHSPGQTNGEGIEGKWFVATPSLTVLTAPAGTKTPCTGQYCP